MAEQERKMAEQDRKMAEQDRKMSERDRKVGESENYDEPPGERKSRKPVRAEEDEPDEVPNDLEDRFEEEKRPRLSADRRSDSPVPVVIVNPDGEEDEDGFDEDKPSKPSGKKRSASSSLLAMAELDDEEDEDGFDEDKPSKPSGKKRSASSSLLAMAELEDEEDESDDDLDEDEPVKVLPSSGHPGRSKLAKVSLEERHHQDLEAEEEDVHGENKSDSKGKSERVTSIYDEYRELLEETKQTHTIEDEPVGPPLDVNLLSNLVYWASLAKQRVGEEQLKDILQLYIQSGHSRPELKDLLLHICNMVDVESVEVEENGSDWVDLLFHLHGILTGGFPVIKIPYIKLPAQEEA